MLFRSRYEMKKATVPQDKPCDTPRKTFVPKTCTIDFEHPEHGESWISIKENDMNDNIMLWVSWSDGMEAYEPREGMKAAKTIIKNVKAKHPDAVVESNHEGWQA